MNGLYGGIRIVPAYTDYLSSIELEGRHGIPKKKRLVNSLLVLLDAMYSCVRKCFPRYISAEHPNLTLRLILDNPQSPKPLHQQYSLIPTIDLDISNMQVASILSDLTSLRACVSHPIHLLLQPPPLLTPPQGHDEALALVRANQTHQNLNATASPPAKGRRASIPAPSTTQAESADPDLQRALDLVDLHFSVKVKHLQGPDVGLQRASADVDAVRRKFVGRGGGRR